VSLAVTGLVVWVAYLLLDRPVLAWTAVGILVGIALLGLAMFARWIPVYRMADDRDRVPVGATAGGTPEGRSPRDLPAEGSFPLLIVLAHGAFAASTVVLVVLTALGVGGS
jgi:hypothetical protein